MIIKNMIIFKFCNLNGYDITYKNLNKESLKNIPIVKDDKAVGIVLKSRIKGDKVIGKVAWWTNYLEGRPKKKYDDVEFSLIEDKFNLMSIIIK